VAIKMEKNLNFVKILLQDYKINLNKKYFIEIETPVISILTSTKAHYKTWPEANVFVQFALIF
jgi:hypothetical protein